ncbi:hypothetical protein RhiirA5_439680 [Rhizophagus irregularis]|uniref:Uncharacterized protein n=1 Tax=Rhizophagus irregularis TaxID=588596 RepID=A0A2N0NHN2_9GLOM|nr:hypothetical protein RhiirA5_439680 [Rhizophagus irregularis]GET52852.1 hypothetical protein RIR_e24626_A0A2N0NHN2_9GLOM [Rhizophagus irregularis DAOM 181602=DAOM 197198]
MTKVIIDRPKSKMNEVSSLRRHSLKRERFAMLKTCELLILFFLKNNYWWVYK